ATTIAIISTSTTSLIRWGRCRSTRPWKAESDGAAVAQEGCRDHRPGLDWRDPGPAVDRGGAGRGRDRARSLARYRHRLQHRLHAGRAAVCDPQGSVPQSGAGSHDDAQPARPDRAADARLRVFPAGSWRGRGGCALERQDLAVLGKRFPDSYAPDAPL